MNNEELQYQSFLKLENIISECQPCKTYNIPDYRDGETYIYNDELKLAIEVALVTNRPLLLRGDPGAGKSSMAAFVARNLDWRYYEYIITARTKARDLLWKYDSIKRLRDAQDRREFNEYSYIEPGVIWWLFDRESALHRGGADGAGSDPAEEPNKEINEKRHGQGAVLLIDEIDKADPDVPNDLLIPLGSCMFRVDELGLDIKCKDIFNKTSGEGMHSNHLIIITTNEERELPQAFLRRCIVYKLKHPDKEQLVEIAKCHLAKTRDLSQNDVELIESVADKLIILRNAKNSKWSRKPSTAEFLDAVRACLNLQIKAEDGYLWNIMENITMSKQTDLEY